MLQLTVVEAHAGGTVKGTQCTVGPEGATIGRAVDNTWTLTDEHRRLSRHHFEIVYEEGNYLLIDTSTNGSFINVARESIGQGNRTVLRDGDTIRLGYYILSVSLEPGPDAQPPEDDSMNRRRPEPAARQLRATETLLVPPEAPSREEASALNAEGGLPDDHAAEGLRELVKDELAADMPLTPTPPADTPGHRADSGLIPDNWWEDELKGD